MTLSKLGFEIPIYVSHLPNHEELKGRLLEVINSIDAPRNQADESDIARCSYGMFELNRKWHKIFFDAAREHLNEVYDELQTPQWIVHRAWFQHYETANTHRPHNHGGCAWANVYYLDLPNPVFGTIFHHPARQGVEQRGCLPSDSPPVIQPKVKEGDIVTFPGYLEHESPPIEGAEPKTIISFNVLAKPTAKNGAQ